jgi:CheY-like chemotaxis protein
MIAAIRPILLAEDNANDVELTLAALRGDVANPIAVVRDGAEALDFLYRRGAHASRADERPCVILLDLKMPKVDGLEVLRTVKNDPALRTIPVVVLTSSAEESDLVRSYELGVNAYVVKPVAFSEFVGAIKIVGQFWVVINQGPAGSRT